MHEMKHSVWGSNLANQTYANDVLDRGENGSGYRTEKTTGWFGKDRTMQVYVGNKYLPAIDDSYTMRKFQHRCGLLRIVMTPGLKGHPMFVVFLDGHVTSNFHANEMGFRFAPEELRQNDGKPIAEIWFHGFGKRWGPFETYGTTQITCTFANQAQMDQYVDVSNRRMPKTITHKGVSYQSNGSGEYQSSNGSTLPLLVGMYLMLGPNEQQAFAAQNPDMHAMISGDGGDFGGGGAAGDFGSDTPASDPTPEAISFGDAMGDQASVSDSDSYADSSASTGDSGSGGGDSGGGGGGD